jgi:hypothetical protein
MHIYISVPIADVYDKLSILDIKADKITDLDKLSNIRLEIGALKNDIKALQLNFDFYNRLKDINANLFNLLDRMYELKHDVSNPEYSILANKSFTENDRRFRMKRKINILHNSEINEVKSYSAKVCIITNREIEFDTKTIDKIQDLSTYYDKVFFIGSLDKAVFQSDGSIFGISTEEIEDISRHYKDVVKLLI